MSGIKYCARRITHLTTVHWQAQTHACRMAQPMFHVKFGNLFPLSLK